MITKSITITVFTFVTYILYIYKKRVQFVYRTTF